MYPPPEQRIFGRKLQSARIKNANLSRPNRHYPDHFTTLVKFKLTLIYCLCLICNSFFGYQRAGTNVKNHEYREKRTIMESLFDFLVFSRGYPDRGIWFLHVFSYARPQDCLYSIVGGWNSSRSWLRHIRIDCNPLSRLSCQGVNGFGA